jgi:ATP-binding cassette subfamily B protein
MALAGAERIFELMDEESEKDSGYVTLVNAKLGEKGEIIETPEHTGIWAWKHPHGDGTLTYTRLAGGVQMKDVDFCYEEGKPVLHDITLYAEPGQKVAFVGATGAGKNDDNQSDQPLLRHCGRKDTLRRHQHQQDQKRRSQKKPSGRSAGC